MAAEVTEDELATGDTPVGLTEAGPGLITEENVVITKEGSTQRIGCPLKGQTKSLWVPTTFKLKSQKLEISAKKRADFQKLMKLDFWIHTI